MKNSTPLVLAAVSIIATLPTSACESPVDRTGEDQTAESAVPSEQVTKLWVKVTVDAHVLQEMFARDDDGSVMENIRNYYDERREFEEAEGIAPFDGMEILMGSGAVIETEGGYRVTVDPQEWDTGSSTGIQGSEVHQAILHSLEANEVDWCGEMKGYELSDLYVDSYWGVFDTREEYVASIEGYVSCGSGK